MNLNIFKQKAANVYAENKLLKLAFTALLLMSIFNFMAIKDAMNSTRTVILPVGAQGDLWVSANNASDTYIRQVSRYITFMLGNYTASSARAQFEELLIMFSPGTFAGYKTALEKLADDIERFPTISSKVTWVGRTPVLVNENRTKVTVRAVKDRLVNGEIARSTEVDIVITFYFEDGRLWIKDIEEVTVNEGRAR